MPRLKSKENFPPGQFQMLLPETGQQKPFVGSFRAVSEATFRIIKGNPFLAKKHGWPTTFEGVETMVEDYNVKRCIAGGWFDWLLMDAPAPLHNPSAYQKKTLLGSVVAGGNRIKAGIRLLLEWVGDGGLPVEASLANARAAVCAGCPKNDGGDFKAYFTEPIAKKIQTQIEMKHEMRLKTPSDEKLTVCSACDCPLSLKVWVPLDYTLKHTSEETKARLDPRCWILHEQQ